jgi:hypothetical protein
MAASRATSQELFWKTKIKKVKKVVDNNKI